MTVHPATDDLIAFLNEALKSCPEAINVLFGARAICNTEMADHPSIQVGGDEKDGFHVGILGLLNGFCGTVDTDGKHRGYGPIAATIEGEWGSRILRFQRTESLDPSAECEDLPHSGVDG